MVKLMGGCIRIGKDGRKGIQLFPLVSSFMSMHVSLNYLIIFLTALGQDMHLAHTSLSHMHLQ